METPKDYTDVLMYFVPAVLVLMAMFMVMKRAMDTQLVTFKRFIERDLQLRAADERAVRTKESTPLKLQAYERLVLFMERISPNSILVRVHRGGMSAGQLQSDLMSTIRAEFEHNLSQQIYISDQAWEEVKEAKEDMIRIVNNAFNHVGMNATGIQMSTQIFEQVLKTDNVPTQKAVDFLKTEARQLLGH